MDFIEREIIFHGNHFVEFYLDQSAKVQEKIEYVLRIVRMVERVSEKFLSKMEGADGLYKIRVAYSSDIYRIFCCFDEGNIVGLFHGIQKKSQKTPVKELRRRSG